MPKKPPKSLPNRIRYLREKVGMSAEELGDLIGEKQQTVSKLETGSMRLRWDHIVRIARVFKVHPTEVVETATIASLMDEVEPIPGLREIAEIAAATGQQYYRVTGESVADAGVPKGATIGVLQGRTPETGDIVLVSIAHAERGKPAKMLWQFIEPSLLTTNREGVNLALRLDDPAFRISILGVVIKKRNGASEPTH